MDCAGAFRRYADGAERLLARSGVTLSPTDGILVAYSGGADSTFLLRTLLSLSQKIGFPLAALHVEHGIRGEESRSDAAFCRETVTKLGVPITVVSVDVPAACARTGESVETAARRLRYDALKKGLLDLPGFKYIATAHNRDDAAETLLFRLLRGCGTEGAGAIPAVRGNVIRPILDVPSDVIRKTLSSLAIPFVIDSTNADPFCARNYLRHEILPRLARLTPDPGRMLYESSLRFREDDAYLASLADAVPASDRTDRRALRALPDPILKRVLVSEFSRVAPEMPEAVHIDAAVAQIRKERDGEIAFPGGFSFVAVGDAAYFKKGKDDRARVPVTLAPGENEIPFSGDRVVFSILADPSETPSSSNVYNLSKKVILSSATIEGNVVVRPPEPGDRIVYGGFSHEVRTVLSSHRVPREIRRDYPLFCDGAGVLWVPGCAVRDGCDGRGASGEVFVFEISRGLTDRVTEYVGSNGAGCKKERTDGQ
ncbi:MAG: tRNA lysidine(34) synthetase TilS [Clostridia bacterium]|nr:tRNA lysidine(34) synthetase TilS [Clostridia bacterium]